MMPMRIALILILCTFFQETAAQTFVKLRSSPLALTTLRYKDLYVKITYSQPQRKQRELFGHLVPYGEVWRTGANEATEITLTRDIRVGEQLLPAGTYSIFTLPEADFWTVIFNRDVGLWGTYNYLEANDVLRLRVPVERSDEYYDVFTLYFDHRNNIADLIMTWDHIRIAIPMKFPN